METALQTVEKQQITIPTDIAPTDLIAAISGDLGKLSPDGKLKYYAALCQFTGLNPLAFPFEWVVFQGKLRLYAKKDCAEQLRQLHDITIDVNGIERKMEHGCYIVTIPASKPSVKGGPPRTDVASGVVPFDEKMLPADKANAIMKAETKAKRRVTFSIVGLGMLERPDGETTRTGNEASNVATVESAEDRAAELNKLTEGVIDVTPQSSPAGAEHNTAPADSAPADVLPASKPAEPMTKPAAEPASQPESASPPASTPAQAGAGVWVVDGKLTKQGVAEVQRKILARGEDVGLKVLDYLVEKNLIADRADLSTMDPKAVKMILEKVVTFWKWFDGWGAGKANGGAK